MPSYKKFFCSATEMNEEMNKMQSQDPVPHQSTLVEGKMSPVLPSGEKRREETNSFQSVSLSMKCQHWHGRVLQQHSAWTKGRTCANWAKTWANNPLCMQNSLSFREIQESFPARAFHIFYLHNFEKSEGILLWFWVQMLRPVNISPLAVPFRLLVLSHYSLFPLLPPT